MAQANLISGRRALDAHRRIQEFDRGRSDVGDGVKRFDWSRHHDTTRREMRGRGMDAAPSSGMAFLQSALELIEPKLVEPLQAVTHPRDITVKFGGGFPDYLTAWASNYASSGGGNYGLQGTNNTDIPEAQIDVEKGSWPTFNWSQSFTITYIDLEKMKFAQKFGNQPPYTLQQLYEKSVRTIWGKALDLVTYKGFLGNAGLINNANVPAAVAVNGGSGTQWSTKTPAQILDDVNFGINQTVKNSGYDVVSGAADTLLIPYDQFAYLSRPMTIGGVGYESTIQYIRKNCVAAQYFSSAERFKIFPLPNDWISGTGLGSTDRAVFYRNDEDSVLLKVPTAMEPAMTIPTDKGPGYSTFFVGNIGAVMFLRTTTQFYLDQI